MSSHPTPHSSTSPWLLLGVGVGASVVGAAAAAATVLYLQPRISAPAPSAGACALIAEVAKVRTSHSAVSLRLLQTGPARPRRCARTG